MRNSRKKIILIMLSITIFLLVGTTSFATSLKVEPVDFTEEFKNYLELSEEERKGIIAPRSYEIVKNTVPTKNPFKLARVIGSSLETKFSLKDVIPNNVIVKNQGKTNSCWAFATTSSLETNLALKNKQKVYDFSERHMDYSNSRIFKDNVINPTGYNRKVGDGGTFDIALAYLTNGNGAINESQMPFEDSLETIYISEIQNKKVNAEVLDTLQFPSYEASEVTEDIKNQIKNHIKSYGSISAYIYGAKLMSEYYNNDTGALYCDNKEQCPTNHGVSIIGWDDNYSKENFASNHIPTSNGAWIIKNSWGEELETNLTDLRTEYKQVYFAKYPEECQNNNWTKSSEIPDEVVDQFITNDNFTIKDGKAYLKIGDNGIMYVSYQDVNIYSTLFGIEKAEDTVSYDNIYQYDEFGQNYTIQINSKKTYVGNIFNKKTSEDEYITKASIFVPESCTCSVYVNPNGKSMSKNDLIKTQLENGTTKTVSPGYHTFVLAEPLKINSDEFAVVIEIQGNRQNAVNIAVERNIENSWYDVVALENKKCYVTDEEGFEQNGWTDLSTFNQSNAGIPNSDSTLKAFTIVKQSPVTLNEIKITTNPNKTKYNVGDNFEKTGMVVTAYYSDGTQKDITDYLITDGTNLKKGQTFVTISYNGLTVKQSITVKEKEAEKPEEKPEENAINSDLTKLSSKVTSVKAYTFSDKAKKPYTEVKLEISNVKQNSANDSYEYYYYVSGSDNEDNIARWTKIEEKSISNGKISLTLNSKNIENYDELSSANKLYLYIKEVAKKGNNQAIGISNAILVEANTNIETYVDGNKVNVENINANTNTNGNKGISNNSNGSGTKDNTVATGIIPQTGSRAGIICIIIFAIISFGIVGYIKYRGIKKYTK